MKLSDVLSCEFPEAFQLAGEFSEFHGEDIKLSHTHMVLYKIARVMLPQNATYGEIGSHIGNSAATVAKNETTRIICFDAPDHGWGGDGAAVGKLRKTLDHLNVQDRAATFIEGDSHSDFIKEQIITFGPYDLFLVDGDHSAEGAREDLDVVYSNLPRGGILVFDDLILHPELETVFNQFVKEHKPAYSKKIMALTEAEKKNDILLRGVGVLVK